MCELELRPELSGKLKRQLLLENLVLKTLFLFYYVLKLNLLI